ncbi:MAG: SH3 domain-containing protein [Lachnospiraceae bacterium]|nr:SH3 domain-containing protein [Lachnospiraceae bacterium]
MRAERRGPSGYEYSRSRNPRRRRSGFPKALILLIVVVVIAAVGGILAYRHFGYTKERMDLYEYLGIEDGGMAVFVDSVQITDLEAPPAVRSGGNVYIDLYFADQYLPNRFYYNSDGTLRYMYPEEIIRIAEGETGWTVGGERTELHIPCFIVQDGRVYVSAEMIESFTDIGVTDYTDPDRIFIDHRDGREIQTAVARRSTQIRYRGGPKSPILMDVPSGTEVRVLSTVDDWVQVSWGGVTGYVPAKDLGEIVSQVPGVVSRVPEFPGVQLGHDVLLMFQQVYTEGNNANLEMIAESAPGMNVIAPTWYSLTDASGGFSSFSDPEYVRRAHALGIDVWGVVDDINGDISYEDLAAVLGNASVRESLVRSLVTEALNTGLDGLNLDIEHAVHAGVEREFTAFMRELSVECRKNGLVLSVDNYIVRGGPPHDLVEEDLICDYLVMMSYDEYWNDASGAGPTASVDWFASGVYDTVARGVRPEKIVNGIAAYTKVWSVTPAGAEDGTIGFRSASMGEAVAELSAHQAAVAQDGVSGIMYGTYDADGSTYQIWYDDASTIRAKLDAISQYDIAGYAVWSARWWVDWNDAEVWNVLRDSLDLG